MFGAGSGPSVSAGIISGAGVHNAAGIRDVSAPDDHYTTGPHCRVVEPRVGRVDGAGGCPTVGARVISPAGIQIMGGTVAKVSAPDNHFAAGPHCRLAFSGRGRVGEGRCSPRVIGAATRGTSYYRKLVGAVHLNPLGD